MAQQDAQFSQNMFNKLPVNPGYAGTSDAICGTLLYRQQWLGFIKGNEGIPKTALLSVDAPVKAIHGGLGLTVISDKIGFESGIAAKLAYSYHMDLGPGKLGIGLDAGILQKGIEGGKWVAVTPSDPSIPVTSSDLSPDFGLGLYYTTSDLYVGASTTHLAKGDLTLGAANFGVARHYYFLGGYNYTVNPIWTVKPSFWIKSDFASTQFDVNVTALYNNLFWFGPSYRLKDAIVAMVGVNVGNLKIGYSYDITTSKIKTYSSGTHEIMIGYCFKPNITKPLPLNRNVRFL